MFIWNLPTEALTQGLKEGPRWRWERYKHFHWLCQNILKCKHSYLQSLEDDTGRSWRACRIVVQLLLQAAEQTTEVRGRVVGSSPTVLDGAECFRK